MSDFRNTARELEAQRLLDALREEPIAEGQSGVDDAAQIRALSGALRRVPKRSRRRRWAIIGAPLLVAASAAASIALFTFGNQEGDTSGRTTAATDNAIQAGVEVVASNGAQATGGVGSRPLASGERLGRGASLQAGSTEMQLRFPSGSTAVVAAGSKLRLEAVGESAQETLALDVGRVEVEVPPHPGPLEFAVATSDVRVVVHGTHFVVETGNAEGALTRVLVQRGVVSVEPHQGRSIRLTAGESWPPEDVDAGSALQPDDTRALDDTQTLDEQALGAEQGVTSSQAAPPQRKRPRTTRKSKRRPKSASLARENELFARAMAHKREKQLPRALSLLEQFLRKYPRSVLAQEARIEHFRVLQAMGRHADAAKSARRYLGQFPRGYARQEARDRVLELP